MNQDQKDSLIAIVSVLTLIFAVFWFLTEPKFETLILVFSTIATVLTFYSGKKKVAKVEKRYITTPKKLFEVSVALWGPTGSGKSWLILALSRILSIKYNKEVEGLHYELEKVFDFNSQNEFHIMPESKATTDIEDTLISFERSRTTEKFGQSISSFKHRIQISDQPGDETTGAILEASNTEENRARVLSATEILSNSDIIIITLDPTQFYFYEEHYYRFAHVLT